ncbi:MAG TPA: AcrB/AcrD/AcrF family protein [Candidatus Sulfotelmatobacter sp.]|nr:AcrB/AcrD/AcrF family protein [Candidatus Sulfotelmatobacter sp.]
MFIPPNFPVALLMVIVSTLCWGSWANTFKGTKNYRFELFYWDYAIGIFLISLILAFTMGSMGDPATSFLANVRAADSSNILYAMIGGVIFNAANLLLVAGIDMAGLAVAFPVGIGIALVVGVVSSYALQPKGNGILLGAGVLFALLAVIFDGKAYAMLGSSGRTITRKSIIVCIISGILMGLFAPFVTRALTTGHALSPYSIAVSFTLAALLSCLFINTIFMRYPLVGAPVNFSDFFKASGRDHLLGLLGGFVWGTGTVFNFVAASFTGVAISYAIGQSAPMVAALWGLFVWKEFAGSGGKANKYLALMFACYVLAIILVARAYSS